MRRPIIEAMPTLVPNGFIYLKASPTTCHDRLKKRNRSEEAGIELNYLEVRPPRRGAAQRGAAQHSAAMRPRGAHVWSLWVGARQGEASNQEYNGEARACMRQPCLGAKAAGMAGCRIWHDVYAARTSDRASATPFLALPTTASSLLKAHTALLICLVSPPPRVCM